MAPAAQGTEAPGGGFLGRLPCGPRPGRRGVGLSRGSRWTIASCLPSSSTKSRMRASLSRCVWVTPPALVNSTRCPPVVPTTASPQLTRAYHA